MAQALSAREAAKLLAANIESLCAEILPAGRRVGTEWRVGDIKGAPGNSLAIELKGENAGLWADFADESNYSGDALDLIKEALGLSTAEAIKWTADRFGVPSSNGSGAKHHEAMSPPPRAHGSLGEWTQAWEYTDAKGQSLMWVCRFPSSADHDPFGKTFRPWNGYRWKDPKGKLPLYGLAEIAAHPDKPVLVVEGEKTADHARDLLPDVAVITWPHGSKATHKADWTPLRLRDVTFWPDADVAGESAMQEAAHHALQAGAFAARIVTLPEGLPEAWDLADPPPDGWNEDTLAEMIGAAHSKDSATAPSSAANDLSGEIKLVEWQGRDIPERPWIVSQLVPSRNVTMLSGDGGLGKTLLTLQLMAACATGQTWLGRSVKQCKSVALLCEDDEEEILRRLADVARHYGTSFAELSSHIKLFCRVGLDNALMGFASNFGEGETTELHTLVMNQALAFGAHLVVVDSLHDTFTGNEINRVQARQFVNSLRHISLEIDGAVVLNAHPSVAGRTTGTGEAGSTAWHNAVRSRLYFTAPREEEGNSDKDRRVLSSKKANYAKLGEDINIRWERGVFVVDEPTSYERRARENEVDRVFLEALQTLHDRHIKAAFSNTSQNRADKQIVNQKLNQAIPANELKEAMMRLVETGKIKNVPYGKAKDGTTHLVIAGPKEPDLDA